MSDGDSEEVVERLGKRALEIVEIVGGDGGDDGGVTDEGICHILGCLFGGSWP